MVATALLFALVVQGQQPTFLAKDTMPKPSVNLLVGHTIPAPKEHPTFHPLKVRFPTIVKVGSEPFIFEGARGGRISVRVNEGPDARAAIKKSMADMEAWFTKKKGRLDTSMFVAKPWFGVVKGPNSDGGRHVDRFSIMHIDRSIVITVDASWPARNPKAENEAIEMARFVIWTAETEAQ